MCALHSVIPELGIHLSIATAITLSRSLAKEGFCGNVQLLLCRVGVRSREIELLISSVGFGIPPYSQTNLQMGFSGGLVAKCVCTPTRSM